MTAKSLIPAIHACRKKVAGLEAEEDWRDFLEKHTGKRGLREMTGPELGRVLDALHASGAPMVPGKGARRKLAQGAAAPDQVRMIRGIWLELRDLGALRDASEAALAGFVRRQTGVDSPSWIDSRQANAVIEALKSWRDRVRLRHGAS